MATRTERDAVRRVEEAAAAAARDREAAEQAADEARQEREATAAIVASGGATYGAERPLVMPPPGALTPEDLTLEAWQDRLDQLEPEGGVYVRVSRMGDSSREIAWITDLDDPQGRVEQIIEHEAQRKGHAGPSVTFRLQPVSRKSNRYLAYADGRSAVHYLTLAIAPAPPAPAGAVAAAAAVDPIQGARAILEASRELAPKGAQDPMASLVAAVGLVEKFAATQQGPMKDLLAAAAPLLTMALERLLKPAPAPDLLATLKQAQDLGLIQRPGGEGGGDSALERVEDIRAMIDLVRPLVDRGEPSIGLELARTIGPQVPRMVERITASVDRVVDYKREQMYVRGGRTVPARRAQTAPPAVEPSAAATALVAVLNEAAPAAQRGDEGHFPALAEALRARVPGCAALLDDVRAGRTTPEQAMAGMRAIGVDVLEPLAGYLRRFLVWWREPSAVPVPASSPVPSPGAPAGVVGRCERCGAEYNYPSRADLETEAEPCDAAVEGGGPCGGTVRPVEAAA